MRELFPDWDHSHVDNKAQEGILLSTTKDNTFRILHINGFTKILFQEDIFLKNA